MMDHDENYFIAHYRLIEERIDLCVHNIEVRLNELYARHSDGQYHKKLGKLSNNRTSPFSNQSFLTFKPPYIRDFRNFSGPSNDDAKQIRDFAGTENIDALIKNKIWSKESKQQLKEAIIEHYAKIHSIELLKQKSLLTGQLSEASAQNRPEIEQKLSLIEEQEKQVETGKQERIYVPEDRFDSSIDWFAISAKLKNTHHDAQDCRLLWSNQLHRSVNNELWTKEEDFCLLNAVQKYGKNDWDSVAKELNSNRLPWQCCSRYHQELVKASHNLAPITKDDTDKIIEVINLCRIGHYVPWNQVMYFIQYHSLLQVKYQWHKHLSEKKSNNPWTFAEDQVLLQLVDKYGDKGWNRIASHISGRSNRSCRERYIMRLKFQRRAIGQWRRKEDAALLSLINKFGVNWSLIASHFPERNHHQLRNRYELLKNNCIRVGSIKHRKLHKNHDGQLVSRYGRRQKPTSEYEVDEQLRKIFATYQNVQLSSKSLTCRSAQDEWIYQNLIHVLRNILLGTEPEQTLLGKVLKKAIEKSVNETSGLFPPCFSTMRGYKAWTIQQDYLKQLSCTNSDSDTQVYNSAYHQVLQIVVKLFLWPATLARIKPPNFEITSFPRLNIIEKDSKSLYKVREIQKQIATPKI